MITDEVLDAIAGIELHRQQMAKEAGGASAANEGLRKLHELLEHEREALQSHGPGARHEANIEALQAEIERVKELGGGGRASAMPRPERPQPQRPAGGAHEHPRSKGRRTMGRTAR